MMFKLPLISVIVPVYNLENYVHYALESLAKQTYPCFEVIIIDDGSTDQTANLCRRYCDQYQNFFLYQKDNEGLSAARNDGVNQAKGEWVHFLDGDDYIEPYTLEVLMAIQQQTDAQLVMSMQQKTQSYDAFQPKPDGIMDLVTLANAEEALMHVYEGKITSWNLGGHLIPRGLALKERFTTGMLYEDFDIMYRYLSQVDRVAIFPLAGHHYYMRTGSITHSVFTSRNLDFFAAAKKNRQYIAQQYPTNDKMRDQLVFYMIWQSFVFFATLCKSSADKRYFYMIRDELRPYWRDIVISRRFSVLRKVYLLLVLLSPQTYVLKQKIRGH